MKNERRSSKIQGIVEMKEGRRGRKEEQRMKNKEDSRRNIGDG